MSTYKRSDDTFKQRLQAIADARQAKADADLTELRAAAARVRKQTRGTSEAESALKRAHSRLPELKAEADKATKDLTVHTQAYGAIAFALAVLIIVCILGAMLGGSLIGCIAGIVAAGVWLACTGNVGQVRNERRR